MKLDLLWALGALVIPLVGVAFSMLKNRVDRIEENFSHSIGRMHAEIKDLQVYVRHEVRDINDNLMNSITNDRQFTINKLIDSMERVVESVQKKSVDEIAERRRAKNG